MDTALHYLAGDIGGTHTRLLLARVEGRAAPHYLHRAIYPSSEYDALDPILMEFLLDAPDLDGACLAVAGPVITEDDGRQHVRLTNLDWHLDSRLLAERFELDTLHLINDVEAIGYGLAALGKRDVATLQAGRPRGEGVRAVLAAGTGLGQAIIVTRAAHRRRRVQVIPGEAGHRDLAPANLHEVQLWEWLHGQYGRATWEHCLSGPGLLDLYRFCANEQCMQAPPRHEPAAITAAAMHDSDPVAVAALDLFVGLYASAAANLALACLPRGGLYLGGGIAPQILARLRQPDFLAHFLHKAPMEHLLREIPLHVITHDSPGLLGALQVAQEV